MREAASSTSIGGPPDFIEPTFGQRLLAPLVDTLVLLPAILLIAAVATGQARRALGLALVAAYQVAMVAWRGQTLGKVAMQTRIVDRNNGATPSLQQSVVRWLIVFAGAVVALAFPVLDRLEVIYTIVVLAPIMRPPLHRGIHDSVAGTVVTSVRPAAPGG